MHTRGGTTILVRVHDLETQEIFALAKTAARQNASRLHVPNLAESDGVPPADVDLCATVVLIGIRDAAFAERLRNAGKTVLAIEDACHVNNDGTRFDGRSGVSRIEQAIELLGLNPPQEVRERIERIAANARGGIPCLVETIRRLLPDLERGVIIETALALRLEAAAARAAYIAQQKTAESLPADQDALQAAREAIGGAIRLRVFATNRRLKDDPELILVHAPERYRLVLEDAIYADRWQNGTDRLDRRLDILALYQRDGVREASLARIEFRGSAEHLPLFEEILVPERRRAWMTDRLDARAVVNDALQCRFADRSGTENTALSALADHLLDHLLIGNRPLRAWRTSFLQPLRLANPERLEDERRVLLDTAVSPVAPGLTRSFADPEERSYFLSHLRRHIVPTQEEVGESAADGDRSLDTVLLSFEIKSTPLYLRITRSDGAPPCRQRIRAQYLHLFTAQCLVFEWVMDDETDEPMPPDADGRELRDDERLWYEYLRWTETTGPALADLLDLNYYARFVYSSFVAEKEEKRARVDLLDDADRELGTLELWRDVSADQPCCGWFAALLREGPGRFCGGIINSSRLALLSDDRARVLSSVVAAGGPPTLAATTDAFDAMLARLRMVDPFGRGFAYDAAFARDELRQGSYRRFAGFGTHYGISPHSFACLTFGSYGRRVVHANHMRTMYRRMFLLTVFYRAILQALAHDISAALGTTQGARERGLSGTYLALRPQLLTFTNLLWFPTVSSQVQGVELFNQVQAQAGLSAEYALIEKEIADTDAFGRALSESRRNRLAIAATVLAALFGVPAAVATLIANNAPLAGLWAKLRCTLGWDDPWLLGLVTLVVVAPLVGWWLWPWLRRR